MVKGIIENTHIISSKITKFIWFIGYCNSFKMDMYFETDGVFYYWLKCTFGLPSFTNLRFWSPKFKNSTFGP